VPLVGGEDGERCLGDVGAGDLRVDSQYGIGCHAARDRVDRGPDALVLPGGDGEPDVELRRVDSTFLE
jgi:hypothetical protein